MSCDSLLVHLKKMAFKSRALPGICSLAPKVKSREITKIEGNYPHILIVSLRGVHRPGPNAMAQFLDAFAQHGRIPSKEKKEEIGI